MRDLIILSIVAVAAVLALKRPWVGVMLWTWLSIMNPHRFAWGFAYSAPLAAIAAGATVLGLLMTRDRQSPFQGAPMAWFALFACWMTVSWLFGMDPVGDYAQWNKVIKIYFMTFVAAMLVINRMQILAFAWVTVGSMALLGAKGGLFTVLSGGNSRVWGPPGSFIEDNNEFALSLIMTIPLLHFLQLQVKALWLKYGFTILMMLCAAAAIGTHSRGGFLAIGAMSAMFWLRSRKKALIGGFLLFGVLVALPMMPEHWWTRMETISTYQEDASAMGRINAWGVAWNVAVHNVFGGGMSYQHPIFFFLYGTYETSVRAAHSIYFQVLGNHGFVGLFLFLGIWFSTYRTAGWLRKNGRAQEQSAWTADLGSMIQVSLVGYATGGAFLSLSYFDLPYNMMVLAVMTRAWVERRGWERDVEMPWLQYIGLRRAPKPDPQFGRRAAPGHSSP
ncbi:putative O-glycosylation ligase, exosortase A system-associated [Thauera phenylacetica]|uniref:putative O-glycosylation ligase, exosortase A system-associated n=1 Tax=Thauera phenylacetica TaxID=164400 RepID=UPI0039E4E4CF